MSDWRADGALFASQALKARLADACGRELLGGLMARNPEEWERGMLSPQVFAFLANEPRAWSSAELAAELPRDGHSETHGALQVYADPGPLFEQLLQGLGKGSRRQNCEGACFLTPESSSYAPFTESIAAAGTLIGEVAPGFAVDMRQAVHAIALVDEQASFRGSSGIIHRGLIFLSPTDDWTTATFAEELVHETTHCLLDLLSLRAPLLVGDDVFEERYAAPFRPDKRHVFGNFHAVIVVARLLFLFDRFIEADVPGEPWSEKSRDYAIRTREPLETVAAYPGLSPLARMLIEQLARPVIEDVLARG